MTPRSVRHYARHDMLSDAQIDAALPELVAAGKSKGAIRETLHIGPDRLDRRLRALGLTISYVPLGVVWAPVEAAPVESGRFLVGDSPGCWI